MSTKGLGVVSNHVEKIVLIAAIILGAVLIFLFSLGSPYNITLRISGAQREIAPAQVSENVQEAADRLGAMLRSDRLPPELSDLTVADYAAAFAAQLDRSLATDPAQLVPLGPPGLAAGDFSAKGPETTELVEVPTPPAPRDIVTEAGYGVLDSNMDPAQLAQLTQLIGDQEPRDFRYVSVGGVIDLAAWEDRFNSVPMDRQVPPSWQRSAMFAVDVVLERQTLDATSKVWSQPEVIDPMPGQMNFRDVKIESDEDAEAVLQVIRDQSQLILNPSFVPLVGGPPWQPPTGVARGLTASDHVKLAQLNREIERMEKQLDVYQRRAAGAADTRSPSPSRTAARSTPAYDPESPTEESIAASAQAAGVSSSSRSTAGRTTRTPRQSFDQQLTDLREQFDEKVRQRDDLVNLAREALSAYKPQSTDASNDDDDAQNQELHFWVNDLTVKPGQTYRYRVTAHMINPLFQRQQYLMAEQRPEADVLTVASESSQWTEPISIEPEYQVFVIAGSTEKHFVSAEVYRLYDGVWRAFEFPNLSPGDPLCQEADTSEDDQQSPMDCESDLVLLDVLRGQAASGSAADTLALFVQTDSDRITQHSVRNDAASAQRQRLLNDQMLSELVGQPEGSAGGDRGTSSTPDRPSDGGPAELPDGFEFPEDYGGPAGYN